MNALMNLTMYDGLESTGESAFCVLLKFGSPYISESVLEIWQYAFNNMPRLTLNIARSENRCAERLEQDVRERARMLRSGSCPLGLKM